MNEHRTPAAQHRFPGLALLLCVACAALPTGSDGDTLVAVDFAAADALERFEFTDRAAFRWTHDDVADAGCLDLHAASSYVPPHRSPLALAILRRPELGDFVLHVKARQTTAEYGHQDLVFVFGYRDPAHYLYAHVARQADDNAHQVMLVDGAPRRPVTVDRTTGVVWGDGWHDIELRRAGETVEVHFDGERVLRAAAPTWVGRIGLGSFDDTGRFRDLRIAAR